MSSSFAIDVPESLLRRVRAGESRAFEQLYRLFERPVYALAWRMLHDVEEAREAVQDTLLTVYDKLHQFRGDSPFWGWLRQIAVNTCLMRLRKLPAQTDTDSDRLESLENGESPFTDWHQADLERALAGLSVQTRSVVWLYFVEGYTHEEIATAFNLSVSFSKSQLARGLARMRASMASDLGVLAYA